MSRRLKGLSIAAGILIVLALVLFFGWRSFTRRAFPETNGTVAVAGLRDRVEIVRDEYGVPHIYAANPDDLYFAQGYVHAQERFWQMEFQRRVGSGRLSEVFGEATLGIDTDLRHFGFRETSRQIYEQSGPELQQVLAAYAAGVNSYISEREPAELGLEFALLDLQGVTVDVEPWTPVDSLVWGMMLMFDQSDQLRTEMRNIDLLSSLGEPMYNDLRPSYRADRPTIIPEEEVVNMPGGRANAQVPAFDEKTLAYLLDLSAGLRRPGCDAAFASRVGFSDF